MTYSAIYNEVVNLRFNSSATKLGQVKNWVQAREGEIWAYADWPIKQSVQLNLTVTGGTATVPVPIGLSWNAQGIDIYDDYGDKLAYMEPADFYELYGASPSAPIANTDPAAWTLVTDPTLSSALVFRVGPTPSASKTFTVQGWNLPIKRTATSTWTLGTMSADADIPWWPDHLHYFIVDGAIAYGKRLEGDPSWQADEDAFRTGLERLRHEIIHPGRSELRQWGDSDYGY